MSFRLGDASIVYYVGDIAQTERFYGEVLGLELERMEAAGSHWLQASLPGGLELLFFQQAGLRGGTPALVFTLPDGGIDDVMGHLAAKGVKVVAPVSEAPGGWSAEVLDPDGFRIGFWQSEERLRSAQ